MKANLEIMSDISFYHLEVSGFETAMPKLLEKVLATGFKTVVRFGNPELMAKLDKDLWGYEEKSFLPHGSKKMGFEEDQPIYLTCELDNPNSANLLLLVNDASSEGIEGYDRVLNMFDGHSDEMINKARKSWKSYKEAGHKLTYFQQNDRGGWEKKMET